MKPITKPNISVIVFAMVFPFLFTLLYFQWLAPVGGLAQQIAYGMGKTIQFALPIFWFGVICREKWWIRPFHRRGLWHGILFGLLVFAVMVVLYHFWFKLPGRPLAADSAAVGAIRNKLTNIGFGTPLLFLLLGAFYSLIHSGLEEYYWRFFVCGFSARMWGWPFAIFLSSVGFTLHHIVLLCNFFGYDNPWAYFLSLCVGVGGAVWAYLYWKSDSIWGPWFSHAVIDMAIFVVGYDILFQ